MSRTPSVYKTAKLRNVTPCDSGEIGVGFDLADGKTLRVKITVEEALEIAHLARSHSRGSSGIPSSDVSSTAEVSA
jgi:hypothetical protein